MRKFLLLLSTPLIAISFFALWNSETFAQVSDFQVIFESDLIALDVDLSEEFAYVASGAEGINIFDVSDKTDISLVGNFNEEGCFFRAIDSQGSYAYTAQAFFLCDDRNSLFIIDASDPSNPIKSDSLNISGPGAANGIYVDDNYAYLMNSHGGMVIIDISNSENLVKLGTYKPNITGLRVGADDIRNGLVVDDVAFLVSNNGYLWLVDVSNKSSPVTISNMEISSNASGMGIDISGNHLYVASGVHGLSIIDITDITEPIEISNVREHVVDEYATDVKISQDMAFVAGYNSKIYVVDVSQPSDPEIIDSHTTGSPNRKIDVAGRYLYLAGDGGLQVIKYDGLFEEEIVEPFLDLPWDYEAMGMSFTDAALAINTFFDHEYPLLSATSLKSVYDVSQILSYDGIKNPERSYTSHDGYDWGSGAKTKYGVPQLAAADGTATYHGYGDREGCWPCGNAIHIDHGNGFQTRHYHLASQGLVVSQEGIEAEVSRGDQIGITGFTGNVIPHGEAGSHVHFMVIEDKNGDGNFDDNIPDGLIDPFGWQSSEPDPWQSLTFNYLGQERTGNESHYLWIHNLSTGEDEGDSSGGTASNEKATITVPEYAVDEAFIISINSTNVNDFGDLQSIGSGVEINIRNLAGETIEFLSAPFELQMKIEDEFLDNIDLSTLAIYTSNDGEVWTKEETQINLDEMYGLAYISHLSYFAIMGERIDSAAPVTTAVVQGEQGQNGYYRSDVHVTLDTQDESDILYTAYQLDNNDWSEYKSPLSLTDEGVYTIKYYSEDEYGSVEDIKETIITIDKTHPEISVTYDLDTRRFIIRTIDEYSTGSPTINKLSGNLKSITTTDTSGNTTETVVVIVDHHKGGNFIPRFITYADGQKLNFGNYHLNVSTHHNNQGLLNQFIQEYKDGFGPQRLKIHYSGDTGLSIINRTDHFGIKTQSVLPGVYPVTLQTNRGAIEFSY